MRIQTATLTVDGAIRANGGFTTAGNGQSGAGGSVWITAGTIGGAGTIEARAGDTPGSGIGGGGGAISVEYTGTTTGTVLTTLLARGGDGVNNLDGGSGTIYVKSPSSTFGDLTIDNKTLTAGKLTDLPSLGSGAAQTGTSGATLMTDRATNIPAMIRLP